MTGPASLFRLVLLLLPAALMLASPAAAESVPVTFDTLDIYWDAGRTTVKADDQAPILQSPKGQKQRKAIISGLCNLANERLLVGKGTGGRGLFKNTNCIDPVAAVYDDILPTSQWRLAASEVTKGKNRLVRLTLIFAPGGAQKPFEIAGIDGAPLDRMGSFLGDDAYQRRLGNLVQAYLPADYAFPNGVKGPGEGARAAPKTLQLFSLTMDLPTQTWRPIVGGTAALHGKAWKVDGEAEPLGYDPARSPARREKDRRSLAAREGALVEAFNSSIVGKIGDLFIDQVSAGYIGMRYGRILVGRSNKLLNQVRLLAIVSEFRSGPLEGLRVYYDWIPKIHAEEDGLRESFGMSRLVVGWGFGFGIPWLIDRVELVPKIGNWKFNAQIPVDTGEAREIRPFALKSGLSFGLEAALEKFSAAYLVRGWASRDFSQSFVAALKSNVTSTRMGLDALIGGPRLPFLGVDFKLAFLLFVVNDHFSIAGTRGDDLGGGTYKITIDAPFAGGGLAITW